MARLPRLVLPGIPCHVTQRGNRRRRTLFEDGDFALYRDLLAESAARRRGGPGCLMPNPVHVVVVLADKDGMRRTFADARRRYTGHLWQGRFGGLRPKPAGNTVLVESRADTYDALRLVTSETVTVKRLDASYATSVTTNTYPAGC